MSFRSLPSSPVLQSRIPLSSLWVSPNSAAGGKDLSLKPGVTIRQEINQNRSEEVSRKINKHTGYLTTQCLE